MKEKLEIVANVIFIGVALLVGFLFVRSMLVTNNGDRDLVVRAGDQLPNLPGYEWSAHEQTLVLALRKDCQYCEGSMPFYRKLVELKNTNRISAHIISLFPDAYEKAREVVDSGKLAVDVIGDTDLRKLKVSGTPTLILVDKQGRVVNSWEGQLPEKLEADVVRILTQPLEISQRQLSCLKRIESL